MKIKDVMGLEKPLIKFMEVVSLGVGKIYEPFHIKRIAESEAKAIEIKSEAKIKADINEIEMIAKKLSENISVPIKYKNDNIEINTNDTSDIIMRAQSRFLYQEIKKQENIESVITKTYTELKGEKETSEEPVDQDWIIRYFNSIEDVSEESMQQIWSKVLSGEIKQPGSFSKRTLDILRNLSKEEAELFEKINKSSIKFNNKNYIVDEADTLVEYNDLLKLSECGLINSTLINWEAYSSNDKDFVSVCDGQVILSSKINENLHISIRAYNFTNTGNQIANIINKEKEKDLLIKVAKAFKKNNLNAKISVHNIINSIDYDDVNLKLEDIDYDDVDLLEKKS